MDNSIRVLVLEDHEVDAELLIQELQRSGLQASWQRVATEANYLSELANSPDLILADYSLPQFDGLQALSLLRERGLDIPFILVSGTIGEEAAVEVMKLGADDYLLKDRIARLPSAVERALKDKRLRFERKRVERQLLAAHEELRQLLEHSPAVLYSVKLEGEKLVPRVVSQNITQMLGFTIKEAMSYDWWVGQLHVEDRDRALDSISETLNLGVSRTEYRLGHKDGSYRWVDDHRRLVRDSANNPSDFIGVWIDITERKEAQIELEATHRQLAEASRQAGMADMATSVLHNVGNVLNSVNVASACVAASLRKSKAADLSKVVALLNEHKTDLGNYLNNDPKGKLVLSYLGRLDEHLAAERHSALQELGQLQKNIEHIKEIVTLQQSGAKLTGLTEMVNVVQLMEDALKLNATSLARHDVSILKEFGEVVPISSQKHKVLHILVNLLRNSSQACDASSRAEKCITLRVSQANDRVYLSVIDNGIGILPENLSRIFTHGFTTKKDGHGFGLHNAALVAKELGGALVAQSDGPGRGSAFTLELPCQPPD